MKRLILLDAHAILHRAYHALPDFSTAKGEPTGALYGLSAMVIKAIEDLKPDYIVACYDLAGPTYRHEAYKDYKAGRKKTEDDLVAQIERSRDIFGALGIPIYDKAGFEADDMLGTIVEQVKKRNAKNKKDGVDIIIASGDMDTLQLVDDERVKVYTLKKGIQDTIIYDEKSVRARFGFGPELIPDYKGLRGDPSDNIIGVKGIGDKTATVLITSFGTIEGMYKELKAEHDAKFLKAGITPRIIQLLRDNQEEAEFSKMLATIRRDAPIEFALPEKTFREALDTQKVKKLWTELEFRSLIQRLEKVITGKPASAGPRPRLAEAVEAEQQARRQQTPTPAREGNLRMQASPDASLFSEGIDKNELRTTALALWLVKSDITDPTLDDILNFANTDDFATAKKTVFEELEKRGLRKIYDTIESPLIPVLDRMQERGIKVDRKVLSSLAKEYHAELDRLEKEIWKHAGMEFNIGSPKQLGEVLFDKLALKAKGLKKTEGGARSTRESELDKLRDQHPIIEQIFKYRELAKLLSTYIDAIPPLLDDNDRLHTRFIQAGSTTGRMASENPNMQNIPIKTELGKAIRKAFVAEKGFCVGGFDYSQMELRIAAFMSGDEKLIGIFTRGEGRPCFSCLVRLQGAAGPALRLRCAAAPRSSTSASSTAWES
jgi:DNA polymerase-1